MIIPTGNVTYDTNLFRDFRFIAGAPENGGTLTIGDGPGSPASLSMDISFDEGADQDGYWSQFNADTLNLNNGVRRRTHTPTTDGTPSSGGLMQFGGIRGFLMPTSKSISPTADDLRMTASSPSAGT